MTLEELVAAVAELDDDQTIYAAQPWSEASRAVAAVEPEDGSLPPEAEGMAYLLEVFLIRDVLEEWSRHQSCATPSPQEACRAVIHYATHDAYLMANE